jgi:5-methylthioadenosine/S-adenosylhomocysteine deaminase
MTPEDAEIAVTLGAIEAARAGTTSILDNHYAPTDESTTLTVAASIESVGLRGVVARGIVGQKTEMAARRRLPDALFRYSPDEELEITARCIERRPPGSKVGVWPAPLNVTYVDRRLLRDSVELAERLGTRWHSHCSEAENDPQSFIEAYGLRPVEWLEGEGLLDERATLAHTIWLDDREVGYLGRRGANLAHNPVSNAYISSGRMRLPELRASGAVVGLGTDGSCVGHRQDLFECMKQTILIQRLSTLDPAVVRCETALELATREGARYLGLDAGVLAPGKLADVVVVNVSGPHMRPMHRGVAAIVYSARGSDVDYTICGGRIVFEGGRCTLIDESAVVAAADERAESIVQRAGLSPLRVQWS